MPGASAWALTFSLRSTTKGLPFFIVLQGLDVLTTLIFMSRGIEEGNPVVRWALLHLHSPWVGLVVTKLAATLIGVYCHRTGRTKLLRRANGGYSLVVAWNLLTIGIAIFVP